MLFDLDGTLADTARDLAAALNSVLEEEQRAPLPFAQIRPHVSNGAAALITFGFGTGLDAQSPHFTQLRQRLVDIYASRLTEETTLFPGMGSLLEYIEQHGMKWGIVTNKPAFLTEPLMDQLGLSARCCCIVSGDSTANRKPHPEPLLYACRLAASRAPHCVYIGDAERDIQAGRRAGMRTIVALFGYIDANDTPSNWGADYLVQAPHEIQPWLTKQSTNNPAL
ncbi:MAG: HAD-IA family hydrolase [Gammaproteobacteria bacterium]|nr:HAD-IA family hydrolase [Gammaproteobacteria bacterium]